MRYMSRETFQIQMPPLSPKTCSLSCINTHKRITECTGIRDKTSFVPLSKYTESNMISDYCYLEDVHRLADNAARNPVKIKAGGVQKRMSVKQQQLVKNCVKRGIKMVFLSKGMSKAKSNQSMFMNKQQNICWTIEWLFEESQFRTIVHNVSENLTIASALDMILKAKHMQNPTSRATVKSYLDVPPFHIYMRDENSKANHPMYFRFELEKTLKEQLGNTAIVEFPTLIVCKKEKVGVHAPPILIIGEKEEVDDGVKQIEPELGAIPMNEEVSAQAVDEAVAQEGGKEDEGEVDDMDEGLVEEAAGDGLEERAEASTG
ncbi:hypothetical protein BC829DRAFT_433263 [Chytridium lagenaria]|nr:hypothetical protein BC829DRAFT_433263 [Chytridium lagenaria]